MYFVLKILTSWKQMQWRTDRCCFLKKITCSEKLIGHDSPQERDLHLAIFTVFFYQNAHLLHYASPMHLHVYPTVYLSMHTILIGWGFPPQPVRSGAKPNLIYIKVWSCTKKNDELADSYRASNKNRIQYILFVKLISLKLCLCRFSENKIGCIGLAADVQIHRFT